MACRPNAFSCEHLIYAASKRISHKYGTDGASCLYDATCDRSTRRPCQKFYCRPRNKSKLKTKLNRKVF